MATPALRTSPLRIPSSSGVRTCVCRMRPTTTSHLKTLRMDDYLLKGGFLWIDDNWDPDFDYIRPNLMRILPGGKIVDVPCVHPMFSMLYRGNPLLQIPSLVSWQRTRLKIEIVLSIVHYLGVVDDHVLL